MDKYLHIRSPSRWLIVISILSKRFLSNSLCIFHTCRCEDDRPSGRERPLPPQPVSKDHLGWGDRESREYSEQVTTTVWSYGRVCLWGLFKRSNHACFYLPGCRLSAMTRPQSCRESLLSTPMEATPETLFRGPGPSQGKTAAGLCHGPAACLACFHSLTDESQHCSCSLRLNTMAAVSFVPAKVTG